MPPAVLNAPPLPLHQQYIYYQQQEQRASANEVNLSQAIQNSQIS